MIASKVPLNIEKHAILFYWYNRDAEAPDLAFVVTLNVTLNSADRLALVDGIFINNVTYNSSYTLDHVQMIIDTSTNVVGKN
jgi:hypothetical protein